MNDKRVDAKKGGGRGTTHKDQWTWERLADEHWSWLGSLLEKVYKDAFVHGFGHGAEWQSKED